MPPTRPLPLLALLLLTTPLDAQRTLLAPAGSDVREGTDNNTIPFWAASMVYQQLHDASDLGRLAGGQPIVITGIAFRKDGEPGGGTQGRTLTVQIACNHTAVSAQTATGSFAANLGANPTVVLPYATITIPPLSHLSRPNPPGIVIPFAAPFVYAPQSGNLAWEWRHRNATARSWVTLDAAAAHVAGMPANEGTGCVVAGQAQPASITTHVCDLPSRGLRNELTHAAASAPAAWFLGTVRAPLALPGLCAPLLLAPAVTLPGATDATGTWDLVITLPDLRGRPSLDLLSQFAFLDASQTVGLELSDMSVAETPVAGASGIARLWFGADGSGNGSENATSGTLERGYGLVTGFVTP